MSDELDLGSFFDDPNTSRALTMATQHITAPTIVGMPLTLEEQMTGGGLRVVHIIADGSPSMSDVANALRDGFNDDFAGAIREARDGDISALRIGGDVFSSQVKPVWKNSKGEYYHQFDQLPALTLAEYDTEKGWGTALHKAILDGSGRAFRYALGLQQQTGIDAEVDIIVLSDGANTEPPHDASVVKQVIQNCDETRVRFIFLYFETSYGLSVTRPAQGELSPLEQYVVNDLGFNSEMVMAFGRKSNETSEEQHQRFRRMLRVLSRVSAARHTSAVVANAAVLNEDDELV